MPDKQRDFETVVKRINRLTQEGKLEWKTVPANLEYFAGADRKVEVFYYTSFNGRQLRLYKETTKIYHDEVRFTWEDFAELEFIDDEERTLWEFPRCAAIWDLLETVSYQLADVDAAIDEIMSDDFDAFLDKD
ncbi:hypothetical protein PDESU_03187 [Pontiella desulfatans]|uniref:Uncharacterized protein n=1 Tax=Pontiella desulfatans TaxID=2750659 RepID=A0A6C2U3N0_PONDE|nr:hypothetical protein [Pontiella desulfatans]VGO14622.1 hypothetical protein PDESU_03187 [Pontiella desulfatans]